MKTQKGRFQKCASERVSVRSSVGLSRVSVILVVCGLLFCVAVFISQASAQVNFATLRGRVADQADAVVSGALVTLTEPATGVKVRQLETDGNGNYELPELKPGTYQLKIDMQGFQSFVARGILLESGQVRRQDIKLKIGSVTDTVEVTAGAAVISTESSTIEGVYDAKKNDTAPLVSIYPSPYSLLTTIPGVQGGGGVYPVVNGQGQAQQTQSSDGIPNDITGEQSDNSNFFQEVAAFTVNAPAESALPVQINETTKRGTDGFHGQANYKIYSSALDAGPYTFGGVPNPKTPYLQHEWDLEVGGPIIKKRTFFYGQWFAQRIPLGTPLAENVPATAWRTGDFSSLLTAATPITITDPQTGLPFPGNIIPAGRLSPVSLAVQKTYYPIPSGTGLDSNGTTINNYITEFPFNSDLYKGDWLDFRVDHNLMAKNTLFVRWLSRRTPYVLNFALPSPLWTRLRNHQQWAAGDTHVFSSRLLNDFRFGFSTDYINDGSTQAGKTPPDGAKILADIGLQGSNPSGLTGQGAPAINFNGSSNVTQFGNVAGGVKSDNSTTTFNDSVTWQVGRHVWKFGGTVQRFKIFRGAVPDYGTINFSDFATGFDYADFLLGIPQQTLRTTPLINRTQHSGALGFYAEDTFKVSPKLTLDYGLRWDYYGAPSAADGLMYNFDPTKGNILVNPDAISKVSPLFPTFTTAKVPPGSCTNPPACTVTVPITIVPGQVSAIPDKHSFAPRFGAAYRLSDNFVLRGGYGIYTARLSSGYGDQNSTGFANSPSYGYFGLINPSLSGTGPFSVAQNYFNSIQSGQPAFQFPNPYPTSTATSQPPSASITGFPRNVTNGLIHQFNVSLERQMGKIGVRASYIGSRSVDMNYSLNINKPQPSTNKFYSAQRPYPQYVNVTTTRYDGSAHYNAFQVAAQRRAGSFSFNVSYTYAQSTSNFLDTENPYDVLSHWSNDGSTMRQYASISAIWALPFGKGRRFLGNAGGLTQRAVGGWSLYSISNLGSGLWYSPSFTSVDSSHTNTFGGLPDRVGDPNSVPGGRNNNHWFNQAAFAVPQPGHFGNALPFSLQSEPLDVHHLSIIKEVPITDRVRFTFTTAFSNIFNHPYFSPPSGNIVVGNGGDAFFSQAGVFSSLERAAPRQITFKGGFTF